MHAAFQYYCIAILYVLYRYFVAAQYSRYPNGTVVGMLVDVSGSMRKPFALDDRSKNTSVERVHAIITTILHIVKSEVNYHHRSDEIFVGAFGLEDDRVNTCDLIALLDIFAGPKKLRKLSAHA